MKFANPVFFWALLSLAIPIVIHLFHFRRFRTVYFTNVRFLKALQEETQSRSRLKHLLVLIARCLALAAIVFAFAQPFIPADRKSTGANRAISVYIDNSFSMDSRGESSSLIELAKKHAAEIIASYKATDRFNLITNDFEGKHQRLVTKDQFIELLEEVDSSPASRKISEVIGRQKDILKQSATSQPIVYLISDFQKNTFDLNTIKPDTSISLNCVHIKPQLADNISIDSVWFESPYREKGKSDNIQLSIRNFSNGRVENLPVKLTVDGAQRGLGSATAGPDSTFNTAISFTASGSGYHSGSLKITDYPVVFDDEFFFSYRIPEKISILTIHGSGENQYLNRLFQSNAAFEYLNTSDLQVDYAGFSNKHLIILNGLKTVSSGLIQELKKFAQQGGSVLIFPSLQSNATSYQMLSKELKAGEYQGVQQIAQKVAKLNDAHRIYDDVFEKKPEGIDLPTVKTYLSFKPGKDSRQEEIMRLQNGDLFLADYDSWKGHTYLCAVPLEEAAGNFQLHALFIPTIYKIALYSIPQTSLFYTIGKDEAIEIQGLRLKGDQPLKIAAADGSFEIIPEQQADEGKMRLFVRDQISKSGIYKVKQADSTLAILAFNYNRTESPNNFEAADELKELLETTGWNNAAVLDGSVKELRQAVMQLDEGQPLWKIFIILALLFLLAEVLLIRFLKS
jgi:hypothetical protein